MIPKKLTNLEEYPQIFSEDWKQLFSLNYFLNLEEALIRIEEIYRKFSLLSSFEIISEPNVAPIIKGYSVYGEEVSSVAPELFPIVVPFLGTPLFSKIKLFETIKREERFELYKSIVGQEFYSKIIDAWKDKLEIDYEPVPTVTFEDVTYPMYLVSKEQVESESFVEMKKRFFMLNVKISYLKCQQFLLVIKNLFDKNEKLNAISFLFDLNNEVKINLNFTEEGVPLDRDSANMLTPDLLDTLNLLAKRDVELVFSAQEMKESSLVAYNNLLEATQNDETEENVKLLKEFISEL